MPQDEQYEWPSFETVLRDVATSDSARPSVDPSPVAESAPMVEPPTAVDASPDHVDDLLPAPLAPLDFDTSAVRALLEPRNPSGDTTFDLDALAPLTPPTTLELDQDPFDEIPFETEVESEVQFESGAQFEVETEVEVEVEPETPSEMIFDLPTEAFEPDSVFDLAFQPDDFTPVEQTAPTPDDMFAESPILEGVEGIELPQSPDKPPEVVSIDELPSGTVFELDESTLNEDEVDVEPAQVEEFEVATIDLFDLQESSEDVEAGRIDEFGENLYGSGLIDQLSIDDSADAFDSIATANAIEGELNELNDLNELEPDFGVDATASAESSNDMFHLDNVIPIRPDASDADMSNLVDEFTDDEKGVPPSAPSGPSPARVSHTGWVGLDNANGAESAEQEDPDPWAHMRPDDEPAQRGFWAKVFGGDERKKAKARRLAQQNASEAEPAADSTPSEGAFDSACPNCGGQCQVDLDDPIGRRVHVSCPSCDHMWNTPYIDATG